MAEKPRIRVKAEGRPTWDSFANVIAHIGQQTRNLSAGADYALNPVSRLRTRLEFMYRGSWLVRKVVDQPADDMTRAGIDIESDLPPEEIDKVHAEWRRLQIWDQLRDTIKWARLYGGAVAMILIDGQAPDTPLRLDTVGKDSFKGLLVFDRWMINPVLSAPIKELGTELGKPEFYETTTADELPRMIVHHSRLLRFDGDPLPYWQRIAENGWTVSVVEQLYDRMVAFDSATMGAAQLVYKAHLRTYKVPGLRELISSGGQMYQAFRESMDFIRLGQSSEGMTIIDGEDELEYHTPGAFSGLSDALTQFGQQLSGACGIPLVILFGQSPSGFSTGDTDVRNYYDRISSRQHSDLDEPVRRLLSIVSRSVLGKGLPEGYGLTFNSLWQPNEKERAETAGTIVTAVTQAHGEGIITTKAAMKELKQASRDTGIFTNITDEEIEAAEDTLAPPDMGGEGEGPGTGPDEGDPATPGAPPGPNESRPGQPKPPAAATPQPEAKKPPAPLRKALDPAKATDLDKDGYHVIKGTPKNVRIRLHPSALARLRLNHNP